VTPPSGHSATNLSRVSPTGISPPNFVDPDDVDYEAMLAPVHDFDNSDFWSDDDDELMRTAMEDLSPKSRRSVRQSLCFLSKRRSVLPINADFSFEKGHIDAETKTVERRINYEAEKKDTFHVPRSEVNNLDDESNCDDTREDENGQDNDDDDSDLFLESSVKSLSENESSATLLLKRLQNLGTNASPTVTPPSTIARRGNTKTKDVERDTRIGDRENRVLVSSLNKRQQPRSAKAMKQSSRNSHNSSTSSTLSPSLSDNSSGASSSGSRCSDVVACSQKPSWRDQSTEKVDSHDVSDNDDDDYDDDVILSSQKPSFHTGRQNTRSSSKKELNFEEAEEEEDLFENSPINAGKSIRCFGSQTNENGKDSFSQARWLGEGKGDIDDDDDDDDDTVASSQPALNFDAENNDDDSVMSSQFPSSKTPRLRQSRR